jgi:hypothetical protein
MTIQALLHDIQCSLDLLWFWQDEPDCYVTCEPLASGVDWLIIIHNPLNPFVHRQTISTSAPITWLQAYADGLNDRLKGLIFAEEAV